MTIDTNLKGVIWILAYSICTKGVRLKLVFYGTSLIKRIPFQHFSLTTMSNTLFFEQSLVLGI